MDVKIISELERGCGVLDVKMVNENAHVFIYLNENEPTLKRIEVDDYDTFYYIVNKLHETDLKIVSFSKDGHYEKLSAVI